MIKFEDTIIFSDPKDIDENEPFEEEAFFTLDGTPVSVEEMNA